MQKAGGMIWGAHFDPALRDGWRLLGEFPRIASAWADFILGYFHGIPDGMSENLNVVLGYFHGISDGMSENLDVLLGYFHGISDGMSENLNVVLGYFDGIPAFARGAGSDLEILDFVLLTSAVSAAGLGLAGWSIRGL
jgi:hypothetical protein